MVCLAKYGKGVSDLRLQEKRVDGPYDRRVKENGGVLESTALTVLKKQESQERPSS